MSAPGRILPERYDPAPVESKWQGVWEREDAFAAEPVARDGAAAPLPDRPKAYVLEMLPYPSGEIHMGHVKNYTMGDVVAHQRRRSGAAVFHPMGYDAFGLPAENAAIRTGEPPATVTARNIARIREQLRRLGFAIDWHTEIATSDPEYYRWTQWLFLRFFERGLAERREAAVNWCPKDQTVLANEQVVDGRCERCGTPGGAAPAHPVVPAHHRLRAAAARRHGRAGRLARARAHDAAQLDRPLRGRPGGLPPGRRLARDPGLHHPPGHAVRRDVLHPRPGAPGARGAGGRPSAGGGGARVRGRRRARLGGRPRGRGPPEDRRLHGPPRRQPGQRRGRSRSGWPTTS